VDNSTLTVVREEPSPCRIKLNIEVAAEKVQQVVETVVMQFQQQGRIPGFRPGKSPRKLLQRIYGKQIQEESKNQLLRDAVQQAIQQQDLRPETQPKVENQEALSVNENASFAFAVGFEVAPDFVLPEYKNLSLSRRQLEVSEQTVEEEIQEFLNNRASYGKVERPAQPGDLLKVNYSGTFQDISDAELQELPQAATYLLQANNSWLKLSEPEMLPGCTEILTGSVDGDKLKFTVNFPESFYEENLAGKSVDYEIEVLEVHASEVPELTEEFVREQLGGESVEQVKQHVRDQLQASNERQQQAALRQQVMDKLVGGMQFPLPQEILGQETYQILSSLYQSAVQGGQAPDSLDHAKLSQEAQGRAVQRLRRRYIMRRIADNENITVSSDDVQNALRFMAAQNRMDVNELSKRLTDTGGIYQLYEDLRESKAVEFIINNATSIETADNGEEGDN